jgi:hypothetical protein
MKVDNKALALFALLIGALCCLLGQHSMPKERERTGQVSSPSKEAKP